MRESDTPFVLLRVLEIGEVGADSSLPNYAVENSAGAHGMSRVSHWMQSRILKQERAPQTTRADFWSDPEKQSPRSRERFGKTFFRSLTERPRRLGQGSVSGWGFEPVPTNKTVVNWKFFVTPTTAAARLQMPKNHEPAVLLVED